MFVKELDSAPHEASFFVVFQVNQVSRTLARWPWLGAMSLVAGVAVTAGALRKELWKALAIMPTACVCKHRTSAALFNPRSPLKSLCLCREV